MMSERPSVLAGDLALCFPPLAPGEVRAVARPLETPGASRLTVVAEDRTGLLADSAGVLAAEGLSVTSASAATWTAEGIALHALTFEPSSTMARDNWDALGRRLRDMGATMSPRPPFAARGRATVTVTGGGTGQVVVEVGAPNQLGLLEATTRWFAEHGVSIQAARVATRDGMARDAFIVDGAFDADALAAHLSTAPRNRWERLVPRCGCLARRAAG